MPLPATTREQADEHVAAALAGNALTMELLRMGCPECTDRACGWAGPCVVHSDLERAARLLDGVVDNDAFQADPASGSVYEGGPVRAERT